MLCPDAQPGPAGAWYMGTRRAAIRGVHEGDVIRWAVRLSSAGRPRGRDWQEGVTVGLEDVGEPGRRSLPPVGPGRGARPVRGGRAQGGCDRPGGRVRAPISAGEGSIRGAGKRLIDCPREVAAGKSNRAAAKTKKTRTAPGRPPGRSLASL